MYYYIIFDLHIQNVDLIFRLLKKQLCYMLARQYVPLDSDDEDLRTILLNAHINDHFLSLGREVIICLPILLFISTNADETKKINL